MHALSTMKRGKRKTSFHFSVRGFKLENSEMQTSPFRMMVWSHSHTCLTPAITLYKAAKTYAKRRFRKNMRPNEFIDKDVFALEEKIGKIKGMEVDPEEWKVTHLEIELTKDIAETVLGAKKGGVRNMINILAIEKGTAAWTEKGLQVRVSKDQLHMYLRPVVKK